MGKSSRIKVLEREVRALENKLEENLQDPVDDDYQEDERDREIKKLKCELSTATECIREQDDRNCELVRWMIELTHKLRETDPTINCRCDDCEAPQYTSVKVINE